jgi:hypothetical protein
LPRTSAFVPLMAELIEQMLQSHRAAESALCGEPLVAHLPDEAGAAAGLRVRGPGAGGSIVGGGSSRRFSDASPDNRRLESPPTEDLRYGELADEAVGVAWRWPAPGPPGVYRVERDGAPVFSMAVNIPAEESQLESLPANVLTGRLAAGRAAVYHAASDEGQRRDDFWRWFAVACVGCVLGEISALLFFRT